MNRKQRLNKLPTTELDRLRQVARQLRRIMHGDNKYYQSLTLADIQNALQEAWCRRAPR